MMKTCMRLSVVLPSRWRRCIFSAADSWSDRCLRKIHGKLNTWTKEIGSRIRAILNQPNVAAVIESCHSLLSLCSVEFQVSIPGGISRLLTLCQLIPHLEIHEMTHFSSNNAKDHRHVLAFLAEVQNTQTIAVEILAVYFPLLPRLNGLQVFFFLGT
jgi:hypothetical protein